MAMHSNVKTIRKNIRSISTNMTKVNNLIHDTAVMIITHADGEGNGDCSEAFNLVEAMPRSFRRDFLVTWFTTYSPIRFNKERSYLARKDKETGERPPYQIEVATNNPFYAIEGEEAPAKEPLSFDKVVALVATLSSSISKRVEKGTISEQAGPAALEVARVLSELRFEDGEGGTTPVTADSDGDEVEAMAAPLQAVA